MFCFGFMEIVNLIPTPVISFIEFIKDGDCIVIIVYNVVLLRLIIA